MSLRGRDFRCELDPDLHEALRVMAEHQGKPIQALGAELLEEAIAGRFHTFRLAQDRVARCGILRDGADSPMKTRK